MKTRVFSIALSLIFVFSAFMSITALAATTSNQDGLVATLSTNQESYDLNEEIVMTLTLENTNAYDVNNVMTEIMLPDGMTIVSGSALQESSTLLEGTTISNEVIVVQTETVVLESSAEQSSNIRLYILLGLAAVCLGMLIFIAIKHKKDKHVDASVIVFALALWGVSSSVIVANANTTVKEFSVLTGIEIDGTESLIEAQITYDYLELDEETDDKTTADTEKDEDANTSVTSSASTYVEIEAESDTDAEVDTDTSSNASSSSGSSSSGTTSSSDSDTVTVSFNTGNGDPIEPIILDTGSALDYYPVATMDGYTFEFWYTEPTMTVMFDYSEPIYQNTTLYASFGDVVSDDLVTYDATELYLEDKSSDFSFTVYSENVITSSNLSSYVSMENTIGQTPTYNVSSSGNNYTITADGGYIAGSLYTATFATGVTLVSPTVDGYNLEAITKLSFRIYKEEIVEYTMNEGIVTIPISDLMVLDENMYSAIISKTALGEKTLDVGTVVYFEDGENSFYVKITSIQDNGDEYSFMFLDASLEDIYDDVDIYFENMPMDVTYVSTEDEIAQMVYESEGVEQLTLLLAAAILESDTVEALGDGTAIVDQMYEVSEAEFIAMATSSTNTSISGTMFADQAELDAEMAYTLAVDLMEDLEVSVTLGAAENSNFDVDSTVSGDGFATDWVGANITLAYETDLGNNVKLSIEVDFSEYLNVTVDGMVSDQYWSWEDFIYYVDFDYAANVYTQTDLGFTILVCSANNDDADDETDQAEDEDLWGDAWTDITDEISSIVEEEDSDSDTLVAQMMAMLEEDGDYITLIDQPIFEFSVNAYVVDINVDVDFVVKAAFAAGISADFSYLGAQQYGMYTTDINGTKYVAYYNNSLEGDGRYAFELSVCGYLGVKAGVALEVGISLPALKSFGNVGLGVEVGAYADLYAYARYLIAKPETNGDIYQSLDGAIYFETGIYLEVYLFAESEMFEAKEDWVFYDNKWPLFSAGNKYVYLGLSAEVNSQIIEDNVIVLTGDFTSKAEVFPTFYGNYLDITTGDIEVEAISTYYTTAKNYSTPYIGETVYWNDYDALSYEYGIGFKFYSSYYTTNYGVMTSDHEINYDYYSSMYGDYDIYQEGDMYFTGTMDIYINYSESTNFLASSDLFVGTMDFVWVSDDYDGSFEGLGEAYTATFELEVEDGDNIVLAEKTVYSGRIVGAIDPYEYASDELKQEYALMSYTPYVTILEEAETYSYYEWDMDADNYMMSNSDVTFTLSAPKRNSQVAYVYYDYENTSWAVQIDTIENGDRPIFDMSVGEYITLDSLSVYDTNTSSSQIVSEPTNLLEVYTGLDLTWWQYGYMINDATDFTSTGYSTQAKAFAYASQMATGYTDFHTIYIADYVFDTYTVTYETNVGTITEEVACYSAPALTGVFDRFLAYQVFEGWDADGNGTIDYDDGEDLPISNEDVSYTAIYSSDYTYTVEMIDAYGICTEYEMMWGEEIDSNVYDIIKANTPLAGYSNDSTEYYAHSWRLTFADGISTTDYYDYETIEERLKSIEDYYYYWGDSHFTIEYIDTSYYQMRVDPGDGTFDEATIEEWLEIYNQYDYFMDGAYDAETGTVSILVKDTWYQEPGVFLAAYSLPDTTEEYYYTFSHWVDGDEVEYELNEATMASEKPMTFTVVTLENEVEYTVGIYTFINSVVDSDLTETFTGNYIEYSELIKTYTDDGYSADNLVDTEQYVYTFGSLSTNTDEDKIVTTIYLYWTSELQKYTVTYTDDDYAEHDSTVDVSYGFTTTAKSLDDIINEEAGAYSSIFLGWDSDGDGAVDYEVYDIITVYDDMELEAVWQNTCTITFIDAYSATHANYTGEVGTNFDIGDVEDPTAAENKQFVKWESEPSTYSVNMTISGEYEYIDRTVTVELTVDGVLNTYTLIAKHYDAISDAMATFTVEEDDINTLSYGKRWSGWYVTDGDTSGYLDVLTNTTITNDDIVVTGTITSVYVTYTLDGEEYSKTAIDIGDIVTVADKMIGYSDWSVNGASVTDGTFTFTMPSTDVTISASTNLEGALAISDGTNTDVYDATSHEASTENDGVSGYTFDAENGVLWIESDGLIISGEAYNITMIVDYDVTTLTLKDLTIQNITTRSYEIENFPWVSGEGVDVDPINAFILYIYGTEFALTIDGDVSFTQTNTADEGDQYAILYSPLVWGMYSYWSYEDECDVEAEGWVYTQGTFTMQGQKDASFTCNSSATTGIGTTGATVISDINFNLKATYYGIRVYSSLDSEYKSYEDGTLKMTNCYVDGEVTASMGACEVIYAFEDITFTNCTFSDYAKASVSSANGKITGLE
ncbi:MAG: InlB B-repeat-containing protein [Lachnospiraceae bacterium]